MELDLDRLHEGLSVPSERRTGRTTRMLVEVIHQSDFPSDGPILVVGISRTHCRQLMDRFCWLADQMGYLVRDADRGFLTVRIQSQRYEFLPARLPRIQSRVPSASLLFLDHGVRETLTAFSERRAVDEMESLESRLRGFHGR